MLCADIAVSHIACFHCGKFKDTLASWSQGKFYIFVNRRICAHKLLYALGIRHNGNLSNASVETLAIIAYNQPVTRSYVDTVRGVDSSYAIGSLLERGLIESKGRLDAPGRPMLYGTTPDFLRCFGLSSVAELPGVSSEEAAEMLAKINRQMEMEMQIDENQVTIDPEAVITQDEGDPTPDPTATAIGETFEPDEE